MVTEEVMVVGMEVVDKVVEKEAVTVEEMGVEREEETEEVVKVVVMVVEKEAVR